MKRVALIGVAGLNLGDTAIAKALGEACKARGWGFTLVHPGLVEHPLPQFAKLPFKRRRPADWFALRRLLRRSDVVLVGGGSLIQDKLGNSIVRGMLPHVFQVTSLVRASGRKPSLICVGVDRLYTWSGKWLAAVVLRKLTDRIIVRDRDSYRRARVLAGGEARLELCPDPAFAFRLPEGPAPEVGVTLVPSRHDIDRTEAAELFTQLVEAAGTKSAPVNIVLSDTSEAERAYTSAIAERLERSGREVRIHIPLSVEELLDRLAATPVVISMRLHPLILAFDARTCVAVSDNSKMVSLARDLQLPRISPARWLAGEKIAFDSSPLAEDARSARQAVKDRHSAAIAKVMGSLQ